MNTTRINRIPANDLPRCWWKSWLCLGLSVGLMLAVGACGSDDDDVDIGQDTSQDTGIQDTSQDTGIEDTGVDAGDTPKGPHSGQTLDEVNIVWQEYGYDVYPTGVPATDEANIQWAIDNVKPIDGSPGKVLLKSHAAGDEGGFKAFDFGPGPYGAIPGNSHINICNDVIIEGEVREDTYSDAADPLSGEKRMTEIHNGWVTFSANWWLSPLFCEGGWAEACAVDACSDGFATHLEMRNLVSRNAHFAFAMWYSAYNTATWEPNILEYTEVENVKIVDLSRTNAEDWNGGWGMCFETDYGTAIARDNYVKFKDEATPIGKVVGLCTTSTITGPTDMDPDSVAIGPAHVEFIGNEIVLPSAQVGSTGIVLEPAVDAIIRDNIITADVGIAARIHNHLTVENNQMTVSRVGLQGLGRDIVPGDNTHPEPESELAAETVVTGNQITVVDTASDDLIHLKAGITSLYNFQMGLDELSCVMPSSKDATFSDNTISGQADYGIHLGDEELDGCSETLVSDLSGLTFLGNDLSGLTASKAQIYLGPNASDNNFGASTNGAGNSLGTVGTSASAAVMVDGDDNSFTGNSYDLTGWPAGTPLWQFGPSASGNSVTSPVLSDSSDPVSHFSDGGTDNTLTP